MSPLRSGNGKDIAEIDALQQCNLINCVDQAGKNDSLHLFLRKLQLQPHNNDPGEVHATGKHFTDFKLKKGKGELWYQISSQYQQIQGVSVCRDQCQRRNSQMSASLRKSPSIELMTRYTLLHINRHLIP